MGKMIGGLGEVGGWVYNVPRTVEHSCVCKGRPVSVGNNLSYRHISGKYYYTLIGIVNTDGKFPGID